LVRARDS